MYERDWWKFYRIDENVGEHLRELFLWERPLQEEGLLEDNKTLA